jgi:hypothetical protein
VSWLSDLGLKPTPYARMKRNPRKFVKSRKTGELVELDPVERLILSRSIAGMEIRDTLKLAADRFGGGSFARRMVAIAFANLVEHGLIRAAEVVGSKEQFGLDAKQRKELGYPQVSNGKR